MVAVDAQVADPPLDRGCAGSVDDELLLLDVVGGGCHQVLDVGAVS